MFALFLWYHTSSCIYFSLSFVRSVGRSVGVGVIIEYCLSFKTYHNNRICNDIVYKCIDCKHAKNANWLHQQFSNFIQTALKRSKTVSLIWINVVNRGAVASYHNIIFATRSPVDFSPISIYLFLFLCLCVRLYAYIVGTVQFQYIFFWFFLLFTWCLLLI